MNSELIDVLMNMFSDFSNNENSEYLMTSSDSIYEILEQSGFSNTDIDKAISWLEAFSIGNANKEITGKQKKSSFRVLSSEEKRCLSVESVFFLSKKQKNDELTNEQLEFILEQALVADKQEMTLKKVSWIYNMTRVNFPNLDFELSDELGKYNQMENTLHCLDNDFLYLIH